MLLLVDENVPDSITTFLRQRGHDVHLVRDSGLKGEPDTYVARAANEIGAIVITFNHRHFAQLIARKAQAGKIRFPNCGRISFRCDEAQGLERLREFMEDIEREYVVAQSRPDKRVILSISANWFSIER